MDGDGAAELAVCARVRGSDYAGVEIDGAVFLLFLAHNGTVKSHVRIQAGTAGFGAQPAAFARDVTALPDMDGDGIPELAVGGSNADTLRGAVWVLLLTAAGGVKS